MTSISSPQTDRLHSISASQALATSATSQSPTISTGSCTLDSHLSAGLLPSKVHELCGPPGAGKTAMAMQMAANTLLSGHRVTWIDTSHPLPKSRLLSMIAAQARPDEDPQGYMASLKTWHARSLPHLLALFLHPLPGSTFPPEGTGLVVIDNVGTVFTAAFPPGSEDFNKKLPAGADKRGSGSASPGPKQPPRKFAVMVDLVKALERLAVTRKIAILVINQMTTRVIARSSAILQPAVISPLWSAALYTRLYIHRNSITPSKLANPDSVPIQQIRFVSILKGNGTSYHDFESGIEGKVAIVIVQIHDGGISDVELLGPLTSTPTLPISKQKIQFLSQSPDTTPSASPLAKLSEIDPDLSQISAIPPPPETPFAQSPLPTSSPLSPPPPSPSYSAAFTPRSQSLVVTGSPEHKRRKTGLELGVVRGSDEEDTDEDWSDEEGALDDGGAPVKVMTAADTDGVNGLTTLAVARQEDGRGSG
ncbi:P-loop containing nucleoside triphosphate hydrolase protein [Morchella snyderi]|nr:P-loop containing nucleoside triphosphate hydrolase protein [Morchella snyderi]